MVLHAVPRRTEYIPFRPNVELTNLPVFSLGLLPTTMEPFRVDALQAALAELLHLPYPRCGFLYRAIPTAISQMAVPTIHRNANRRWYFLLADEQPDGLLVHGYVRHDNMPRWARQTWQAMIDQEALSISYDPEAVQGVDEEFFRVLDEGTNNRLIILMSDIWRITRGNGRVSHSAGTSTTELSNKRRKRDGLPPVPAVRVLDFDAPGRLPAVPSGAGARKAPHFRRGTWRTLPTGKEVWVRPSAIHGGTPDAPPWYETR
jgi:hypothetical protein